jgi:hypothetical protein
MKKITTFFLLFFLAICVFGQSNKPDIDKMMKATFVGGETGGTLDEIFSIFRDSHCHISYDLGLSQPEDPGRRYLSVTVENGARKLFCVNGTSGTLSSP